MDTKNELVVFGYSRQQTQLPTRPEPVVRLILDYYHVDELWEFTDGIIELDKTKKKLTRKWIRVPQATFGYKSRSPRMSVRPRSIFDNTAYGKILIDSTIPAEIIWKFKWDILWHEDFAIGIASIPSQQSPPTKICYSFDECDNIIWYSFRIHSSQTHFECYDIDWNKGGSSIDGNNDGR